MQLTRQAGFNLHVSKPVKRGTLLSMIAKACARAAAVGKGSLEASGYDLTSGLDASRGTWKR